MSDDHHEIEFLDQLCKRRQAVSVFLLSGIKLEGVIHSFDSGTLVLERDGNQQLLFRHAISTIVPS
ncbi:MAG: RNA chaperone Hfq [Pseudomonadota bacterium]